MKTQEQRQQSRFGVFTANPKRITQPTPALSLPILSRHTQTYTHTHIYIYIIYIISIIYIQLEKAT